MYKIDRMEVYNIHPHYVRKARCSQCPQSVPWRWLFILLIITVFTIIYFVESWGFEKTPGQFPVSSGAVTLQKYNLRENDRPEYFIFDEESNTGDGINTTVELENDFKANNTYLFWNPEAEQKEYAVASDIPVVRVVGAQCDKIIQGDKDAIDKASAYQQKFPIHPIPDRSYVEFTSNCATFRQDRQYMLKPVSEEEAKFPIAFSILMFKDVEQFERLLRAIYRPQNYYCVHVDKKSGSDVHRSVESIARCFPNVFVASQSISVSWGTFSVLQPELICMEQLWRYKRWKYLINLTGQEFPLKTNLDLVQILKAFNGSNNMEGTVKRRNRERTEYIHKGFYRTSRKKHRPPVPVTLTKGSVHIAVTRAFVDYVLHDQRALEFRAWVKDTGIPDETFFSSLNHSPQLNVPGAYLGAPETNVRTYPFLTRFKNWGSEVFDYPCAGKRHRLICIFGLGDLKLLAVRPELFANKFHLDYQPLALSCMEQLHFNRTRNEIAGRRFFDVEPYKRFSFVRNHI